MNTLTSVFRKSVSIATIAALSLGGSGIAFTQVASVAHAAAPSWDISGAYTLNMQYQGGDNMHAVMLTQAGDGTLTGSGTSGPFAWIIDTGSISESAFTFTAHYTATDEASSTQMTVTGTVAADGTLSGNWADNYPGPSGSAMVRFGEFSTTAGAALALPGSLAAQDFGVVSYDAGVGTISGYTAGFGLTGATFTGVQSVVVRLYAGDTLLQTNTSTSKVGATIVGADISSPFDVSGTFDYATDGYWINVRAAEYGQTVAASRVTATVVLANGKTVSAEKLILVGDPTTIFPSTNTTGNIGGTVTGGTSGTGALVVTSIDSIKTTAIANGTFADGWKYVFHITVPTTETHLAMRFGDWVNATASSSIAAAGTVRYSSAQAQATSTVLVTAANQYATPALHIVTDMNPLIAGDQIEVVVETQVPVGSVNGVYTTSYGVQTLP